MAFDGLALDIFDMWSCVGLDTCSSNSLFASWYLQDRTTVKEPVDLALQRLHTVHKSVFTVANISQLIQRLQFTVLSLRDLVPCSEDVLGPNQVFKMKSFAFVVEKVELN